MNKEEKLAKLSKALGHPHRLKIIKLLNDLQCECMVGNIVDQLPISQATVSQHLKILKEAGWIKGEIKGPKVCYCLKENIFENYKKMINDLRDDNIAL